MTVDYDSDYIKSVSPHQRKKFRDEDAADSGHNRQQQLLNALTTVAKFAIYAVPSVLAVLYAIILIHKAWIGEWNNLEDTLQSMLIPVTTYLAGLLSKNVLNKHEA